MMPMNDPKTPLYFAVAIGAVYYGTNCAFALANYLFR